MSCFVKKTEEGRYLLVDTISFRVLEGPTRYLEYMRNCNMSPNSIKHSAFSICYYFNYCSEIGAAIEEVICLGYVDIVEHFSRFLKWIKEGGHTTKSTTPSNNTANAYLSDVLRFYDYLQLSRGQETLKVLTPVNHQVVNHYGVRSVKTYNRYKGFLPKDERCGKSIDSDTFSKALDACTNMRDQLILLLMGECGLRIGEVLGINYIEDIDYDNQRISVKYRGDNKNNARAKNQENRRVLVRKETFELLELYIATYQDVLARGKYLFVVLSGESTGSPLKVTAVYSFFRRIAKKIGADSFFPHMLRHYFANERRKSGWQIEMIKEALGHRQIKTTEQYLNIEDDEVYEAAQAYYKSVESKINLSTIISSK